MVLSAAFENLKCITFQSCFFQGFKCVRKGYHTLHDFIRICVHVKVSQFKFAFTLEKEIHTFRVDIEYTTES